jgi:hypothetical protein
LYINGSRPFTFKQPLYYTLAYEWFIVLVKKEGKEMKKSVVFILTTTVLSTAVQEKPMNPKMSVAHAQKGGYYQKIYSLAEAAHYLGQATFAPSKESTVLNTVADLNKAYEEGLDKLDLIAYYQNQYYRSQLFDLARSKGMSVDEVTPLLDRINEHIRTLLEKHVELINEFEKAHAYDFGGATGTNPGTWGPNPPRGSSASTWGLTGDKEMPSGTTDSTRSPVKR